MKKSLIFAACAVAIGAVANQASAMNIQLFNDGKQPVYAYLLGYQPAKPGQPAKRCVYGQQNPIMIQPGASRSFENVDRYGCVGGGRVYLSSTPFDIKSPAVPALNADYQLVEYTFTPGAHPAVDYDVSAVDSLSDMSLAVEAIDPVQTGQTVGWTGTVTPTQSTAYNPPFTQALHTFEQPTKGGFPGWPVMIDSQGKTLNKIPGGFNLFALTGPELNQAQATETRKYIVKRWFDWYAGKAPCQSPLTPSQCSAIQHSVVDVMNAFVANAKVNHQTALPSEVIQHILGYAPFGSSWSPINTKTSEEVIGLLSGVPNASDIHQDAYKAIVYPKPDQANAFDPYVGFIHGQQKYNIYTFSIDDAIGNYDETGYNGIAIDIGSAKHLPDTKQYQPGPTPPPPSSGQYHFNMGGGWGTTQATICGQKHSFSNGGSYAFDINKTCQVTLVNPQASFALAQDSSATNTANPIHLENCTSSSSGFCQGVVVSGDNIDLPGGTGAH